MDRYLLTNSTRKDKKYMVYKVDNQNKKIGNVVHFGAVGYEDYTIHKDDKRRDNYIRRHQEREDWTDLNSAGTWSRFILWGEPSLSKSINKMGKMFNIKILHN
jgi:hypothetical protein